MLSPSTTAEPSSFHPISARSDLGRISPAIRKRPCARYRFPFGSELRSPILSSPGLTRRSIFGGLRLWRGRVDRRVKPGDDNGGGGLARMAGTEELIFLAWNDL